MKTTYLIWKSIPVNGMNPVWQEITGQEFLTLVRSPNVRGRYFIKLASTEIDNSDGSIVMETNRADYLSWKREQNHIDYLASFSEGISVISYHAMVSVDGECYGEENICDENCDVEGDSINKYSREEVREAVSRLNAEEQALIEYFYLSDQKGTERKYSLLTGIPRKTINDRRNRTLVKLLKILSE